VAPDTRLSAPVLFKLNDQIAERQDAKRDKKDRACTNTVAWQVTPANGYGSIAATYDDCTIVLCLTWLDYGIKHVMSDRS
jgi:hypothetical protein